MFTKQKFCLKTSCSLYYELTQYENVLGVGAKAATFYRKRFLFQNEQIM